MTMKLEVIFDRARPDIPTMSAALKEGKYFPDFLVSTMALNFSFSALSDRKNCHQNKGQK
jgi:hypothetical protein